MPLKFALCKNKLKNKKIRNFIHCYSFKESDTGIFKSFSHLKVKGLKILIEKLKIYEFNK